MGKIAFTTNNIIFRPLHRDDKYDIYRLFSEPDVVKLDHSVPMRTIQEAENYIQLAEKAENDPHSILWGGQLKGENKLIGTCGFKNWDRMNHHAEIGGNLSQEFWGKGLASEALQALISYAYNKMMLNKICAYTNCQNNNAIKLLNKYGFSQDGRLRKHQLLDDEYVDVLAFSLLKDEFKK